MSAKPAVFGVSVTNGSLNADAIPRCNTHRKRLKFFCSKHELLLCSVCAVKRHRGCDEVLTVNEACDEKKNEGKKILDVYNQRIALIENAIVERKAAKKLLDSNAQEIQNEVHDVTQKLIELVKQEERTLVQTLQDMQQKESNALEGDISGMENACTKVTNAHDALSQNMKLSDVDLIHAIMKEKQTADENSDVEVIVRKRFREVDFKFIISPHVTSFLKHFKVLGQVMLSEESVNARETAEDSRATRGRGNVIDVNVVATRGRGNVVDVHVDDVIPTPSRARSPASSIRSRQGAISPPSTPNNRPRTISPPLTPNSRQRAISPTSSITSSRQQSRSPTSSVSSRQHHQQSPGGLSQQEGSYISAREKWARDRQQQQQIQQQQQKQNQQHNETHSPYTAERTRTRLFSPQNSARDGEFRIEERRARLLPRPETPEVFGRNTAQTQRHEFVARPMSTPPQENQYQSPSPGFKQSDKFNYANVYRHVKAEPISFSERSSPLPMSQQRMQSIQREILPNSPAQFFHRPSPSSERPTSPDDDRSPSRAKSPPRQGSPAVSVLTVKDDNGGFGRSFAAVQFSNRRAQYNSEDDNRNHVRPKLIQSPQSPMSPEPGNSKETMYIYERRPTVRSSNSDLSVHQTEKHNHVSTEEQNGRRWVHQNSFATNGIKLKRLISGIGALKDGRLIMVDQEHYTVQLFNPSYQFLAELKLESRPFDVSVISDNKVVVSLQSERALKFILVTDDSLTPVADLCVPCDMVCYGLCRGGCNYAVCCGDEVWIVSDEGRVVSRIKTDSSGNKLFTQAEYVTTDPSGNVLFVSDTGSNKILAIQSDGKPLWEFTYQGFKPSGLKLVDIYLFVCDRDQHRVLMLNLDGQVVNQSVIGRLENPRAICFNMAADMLYVTQMRYDAITSPARPIHVFGFQ